MCSKKLPKLHGEKGSENLKFFRFPTDPIISDQWKVICKNENIDVKNGMLNKHLFYLVACVNTIVFVNKINNNNKNNNNKYCFYNNKYFICV